VYRNDFNMDPLPYWRAADAPDRQGITEIRYVEGLYAMWDEIRAKTSGTVPDDCASGGRRIDLEMCIRSIVQTRIAADHDRRGELAARHHVVEADAGEVALAVAEPADAGR
jgi:hypothetical protein